MSELGDHEPIVLTSRRERLLPDISSYLIRVGEEIVVVDPGPIDHLQAHLPLIKEHAAGATRITVVALTPGRTDRASLDLFSGLAPERRLVGDLPAVVTVGSPTGWTESVPQSARTAVSLLGSGELTLVRVPGLSPAGSTLCYDPVSATLYTGPLFGAIGVGRSSEEPVLRREAVKAYTDLYTPDAAASGLIVAISEFEVSRIAPSLGRPALGGLQLIRRVFAPEPADATGNQELSRLFRRLAALEGRPTAEAVFKSTRMDPPDPATGFTEPPPNGARSAVLAHIDRWLEPGVRRALAALEENHERTGAGTKDDHMREDQPPRVRAPGTAHDLTDGEAPRSFDDLTGLPGEQTLREVMRDSLSAGSGLAVLMISVDRIEDINRRFGRTGGDDALYTVAYLINNFRRSVPETDRHTLYKLRGPLFCYLAQDSTLERAERIADGIRESVANSAMFLEQVTVSIGVVASYETPPGAAEAQPQQPESRLLAHTTARLRLAQARGMNTVCATDPEGSHSVTSGHTVLLADPDTPYLDILSRQLEEHGFSVLVCQDGNAALEVIEQIVPDAIVCEAMLPKRSGFALREQLRSSSRLSDIPFILVSHRKTDEQISKASERGIVHFLHKPFSLVELTGLLKNLTEHTD